MAQIDDKAIAAENQSSRAVPEGELRVTSEHPAKPRSLKALLTYLREFLRPAYHLKKIKEDIKASVHALRNRDLVILKDDVDSLAHALRGRLLATYFMVGPFGVLGPVAGTFFQYKIAQNFPGVSMMTFAVTIIVGNIFSIIGFQIIWACSAYYLYRMKPPAFFNWLSLWRDILPLQWKGFQRWAGANVVLVPLCTLALGLIDRFLPQVSKVVPFGVLTPAAEILFVHTSLIRLMGDLFEKESHRIAKNHMTVPPLEG